MKGLSADYDSEKIELKNEENLKAKFSTVYAYHLLQHKLQIM